MRGSKNPLFLIYFLKYIW